MTKKLFIFSFASIFLLGIATTCWGQAADEIEKSKAKEPEFSFKEDLDLTKNHFEHETRAGVIFSTGNTQSINASGTSYTLYRIKRFENKWSLGAFFNRINSSTNPSITPGTLARYIFGTYRLDYYFLPRTSIYVGGGGYTDEIKGIEIAENGFLGIAHYFLLSDNYSLRGSAGYDFTHEDHIEPNPSQDIHSAAQGLHYRQKFNKVVSFAEKVLALENVTDGRDFRLNSDTELILTMTEHLAFVLGFHVRFDNEPVIGFKKLDTITDASLAVTFK